MRLSLSWLLPSCADGSSGYMATLSDKHTGSAARLSVRLGPFLPSPGQGPNSARAERIGE
jgi:hypothetical protein